MILYYYGALTVALVSFFVAFFILVRAKKSLTNIIFALLMLSLGIWAFGYSKYFLYIDPAKVLFWSRISHLGAIAALILLVHYTFAILSETKIIFAAYASIIWVVPFVFSKMFIPSVTSKPFTVYYLNPGKLYHFFTIVYAFWTIYCDYVLWQKIKEASYVYRNQLKYFFLASLCGTWGGATTFPLVYDVKMPPLGIFIMPLYAPLMAYAVLKYQLMDISIVIKKGTVYTYLSFLVLIPCMILIIFAQRFYFDEVNYAFSSLIFALLLLAAIIFSRTKLRVERFIERTLFKEKYEYKEALSKLSKIIISFLDEKKLFKKTSYILTHSLGIEKNSFFLLDREKRAYTLRASKGLDKPKIKELPEGDLFFKWLKESGKIIVKEELERLVDDPKIKPIVETLDSMESEVCIPLITRNELIGTINLGRKRSGDMYSQEDLELLGNLANQAAVALENTRLYEDMKKTQLLMRRSDRLAALGSLTAGLAHEIRNPLVAVKTFLQLLPERFDDEEFRSNFLSLTTSEVERITALVSELLEFARPSEPQLKRANVNEVLQKVIHLITVEAKKRGIAINTNLEETPQAMLDEEQIKQVFLNIFLNAIEAVSASGDISVTSRMTQKNGLEYVQIRIEDTGKGIPRKILDHIFDPFFTTKEKGSGLGLSISHQIVQEHNGSIEVESKSGKGTTFFVNLPCVK